MPLETTPLSLSVVETRSIDVDGSSRLVLSL